jgi:hypothetical protein
LPYYTEWSIRPQDGDLGAWVRRAQLGSWGASCAVVTGEDAGRHVWRAVSAQRSRSTVEHSGTFGGTFGIDIALSIPPGPDLRAADTVKGCIDGVVASFQRFAEP